jgi:hypothetical protein
MVVWMKVSQTWICSRGVVSRVYPYQRLFQIMTILMCKMYSIKPWHTDKMDIMYMLMLQALENCMKSNRLLHEQY